MPKTPTPPAALEADTGPRFDQLGLAEPLLQGLLAAGYETPTPIQAQTIPALLEGRDLLGQAQTGTGKTAAFALPILSRLRLDDLRAPQALVLAPTRELAIQVAEAFQRYASNLRGFHVLPIYGGQSYGPQLHALRRGVHVVVGTPGRVIDHIERGTLRLDSLTTVVLDEADEMLRMGFIDDVEKILQKTPDARQVALFSATMPPQIRRIAQTYLKNPAEITIRGKTTTAVNTRQRYWLVSGVHKLDALTRILEAEPFDGMIVFAGTKQATVELAEKLEARGFACAPLNGDIEQKQRERTVNRLKNGELDIIVATDVAARGLDLDRISHVINYDIPRDSESYVHRIGRTGRAGRSGEAILFISPRERHMLRVIERATRQPITPMELPSASAVNDRRIAQFKDAITHALGNAEGAADLARFQALILEYEREHDVPVVEIAAALARMAQGDKPLLIEAPARRDGPALPPASISPRAQPKGAPQTPFHVPAQKGKPRRHHEAEFEAVPEPVPEPVRPPPKERPARPDKPDRGMETYRVEVGHQHGVKPGNIVGAIANEAGLDGEHIGRIDIYDGYSLVDLPTGMPKDVFQDLRKARVAGQKLLISKVLGTGAEHGKPHPDLHKEKKRPR
ncbi:MAG TPA: DEAD/DEAH box helicase [Solimonas sp.]|nr:DEAD/DEAH box helicase [Solimonas sp.]